MKIVNEGRDSTLKGKIPEASLRDKIPKKLLKKLKELNVGEKAVSIWRVGNANRMQYLQTQRELLSEFEEFIRPIYASPYGWSSTLHLPIAYTLCRTFHSRMMAALFSMDPPFTAIARKEANSDRAPLIQELLRYATKEWANDNRGIEEQCDRWLWNWVTSGRGVLKYKWDRKYSKYIDVVEVQREGPPRYEIDEQGQEIMIPTMVTEEEEQEVVIPCFNGPAVEIVQNEDLLIVGGEGDVDKADSVIQQHFLTASELWVQVDRGVFNREAVEEIISGGPDLKSTDETGSVKQDRAEISQMGTLDTHNDLDRYRILECHMRMDVDGSGINSDIICWVGQSTRQLLFATYSQRVSKSGRRPYATIDFHRRTDTTNPIGLVELTYSLAKEIDTAHNLRVDFGLLSTLPFGYYRASSSMAAEKMPLEPGALIPLDNPQTDIYFPNLGNRTSFGFQEEQALYSMIERMTSVSDLSLGVLGAQGASRTATGSRIVAGESNTNLDIYLKRLNRGFKKLLHGIWEQIQANIEPGLQFRLLGDDGQGYFRVIQSREEIAGNYDFELDGSTASSNKQIQMDTAVQLYQMTANPIDLKLGLITPQERFEACKHYLQAMGVKNWSKFLRKPPQGSRLYTPEEIANRVLAGIDVPLDMTQDLQGFIAYAQYIMDHDELLGQFGKQQAIALARKQAEAAQLQQAMQQASAQNANVNQQRMNAAFSLNQNQPVGGGGGGMPPVG